MEQLQAIIVAPFLRLHGERAICVFLKSVKQKQIKMPHGHQPAEEPIRIHLKADWPFGRSGCLPLSHGSFVEQEVRTQVGISARKLVLHLGKHRIVLRDEVGDVSADVIARPILKSIVDIWQTFATLDGVDVKFSNFTDAAPVAFRGRTPDCAHDVFGHQDQPNAEQGGHRGDGDQHFVPTLHYDQWLVTWRRSCCLKRRCSQSGIRVATKLRKF
ncbi:unnamed protein product [Nesidiocoris tenuis]|uniref:Uncharacterized protein n=1 Tax=Nesidiocoris tenuis TaxID=355587 RepID=A0A6H5GI85_9HEMI|nr:unnamed protein product [Nesidiocoris tenuis]